MANIEEDRELLRRYGLKVPDSMIEEVLKAINSNASYKEELEKVRLQIRNPPSEDDFLQVYPKAI
jgi:L-fucose isomerase-like protein